MTKKLTLLIGLVLFSKSIFAQEPATKDSIAIDTSISPIVSEEVEAPIDTLTRAFNRLADEVGKSSRLKITGYLQPQYQYIDSAGAPSFAGGDFANGNNKYFSRFTMRRGRFKFTYNYENVEFLCNIDATERGLFMRETFVKVSDPWLNMFSLTAGLLQDQFGFELTQSSGVRETPERARFNQILFPVERDLGIFGSVVFPKSSFLYGLKIDAAVMNGVAGVNPEFDSNKDYTGRLQYSRSTKDEKISYAIGVSAYYGGYRIGNQKDYNFGAVNTEKGFVFAKDTANYNRLAKRIYYGVDAQASIDWAIGITTLRAEYITGEQPGTASNNNSPRAAPTAAIYHRQFDGAYFYLIQNIGQSKFQAVVKYDWYDPNIKLAGKQIGIASTNTNSADIKFTTLGFGGTYRINTYVKFMLYYDLVKSENTLVKGYTQDLKDNVITARLQFRF
jgi:phosphate-selective porin